MDLIRLVLRADESSLVLRDAYPGELVLIHDDTKALREIRLSYIEAAALARALNFHVGVE